jgi:hypothetical protein
MLWLTCTICMGVANLNQVFVQISLFEKGAGALQQLTGLTELSFRAKQRF